MHKRLLKIAAGIYLQALVLAIAAAVLAWPPKSCPFKLTGIVLTVLLGGGSLATLTLGKDVLKDSKTWTVFHCLVIFWAVVLGIRLAIDIVTWTPVGGGWDGWLEALGAMTVAIALTSVKTGILFPQREVPSVLDAPPDGEVPDLDSIA